MKKICMIIPFKYKWNTFANVRSHYEYLKKIYQVDLYTREGSLRANLNDYDLIMLHGSGAILTKEQLRSTHTKIFGFGWSDPNLFNETHYNQSDVYFTNDLGISRKLNNKPIHYYQTACNKEFHRTLDLPKETDILVYGQGSHKFITNRNDIVDELRKFGFNIKVFGRGWTQHEDTHPFIEGQRLIEEINKAHVVLDISNGTTAWPHRIFEASACGTPVLTYNREDTRLLFEDNDEIILYDDYAELIVSLSMMIKNKVAMKDLGMSAQKRCYKDHDISVRIQDLIEVIEEEL